MALICSICNEVPEEPVLSLKSNCIFEKRLIVKYIKENGKDPVSGDDIEEADLVNINSTPVSKPRPPSATSIPALLKSLQDEWDACMLHSYTLRQQLQTTRQELSHALYQHDAACRVIARLTKELTAAREALATLKPQAGVSAPAAGAQPVEQMEVEDATQEIGLTKAIIQKLQDTSVALTSERKKRGKTIPEGLAKTSDISKYAEIASLPGLHSASAKGILTIDLQGGNPSRIVTGGVDKNVVVFDRTEDKIIATLKGHSKKVNKVIYHPNEDIVFSGSQDSTVRVWSVPESSSRHMIKVHEKAITGVSLHATGEYLLTSSADQLWAFSDLQSGRVITKSDPGDKQDEFTCAEFHPDGLIFGTGTSDGIIKIWDLKERTNVANFSGHSASITDISFSENGYYLATAAEDSTVKLWDLRKLKNFKSITLDDSVVKSVSFDQSGTYMVIGGSDIRVYLSKQWQLLNTLSGHSADVTGVKFGSNASCIASCSMDRTVKFFGL
ncbi:uncharacterized protein TRIADDRAFT_64168 [Trichoplax adhaerens]|uniref:Pre-mRNA-processing factor 19 n=1 Tax=Trichoplax adhaerens TaxID=10228 RepID=B3S516_TRIAD|nr:hypothetical protein TRIADDRAFT_64168 [Trichoplax adhaerens]EDV22055.1 hypothetical protein TRIADDRAFT_64168 [Trichoplax adhaerens]|eukprot:XP_002115210.1 hypothetical protein TRIADDRAFT_64168 [Trichoplax adhaerens]